MSVGLINAAGVPNTEAYNLGRGRVYIAPLVSGLPEEYRDVGNAPAFALNMEVEELLHQSSRAGVKTTDARVVVSQDIGFTLTLDELSAQNMALFFAAATAEVTNPAVAGITEYLAVASLTKVGGIWLQVHDDGVPARDIDAADLTIVHDKAVAADTLVITTDYTVDEINGRVFLVHPAVTVLSGKTIHITLAAKPGAEALLSQVQGLEASSLTYALMFIGVNPMDADSEMHIILPKVRFSAEGDFGLISDEVTQMQVSGVAEQNALWPDANSQTLSVWMHDQTP